MLLLENINEYNTAVYASMKSLLTSYTNEQNEATISLIFRIVYTNFAPGKTLRYVSKNSAWIGAFKDNIFPSISEEKKIEKDVH